MEKLEAIRKITDAIHVSDSAKMFLIKRVFGTKENEVEAIVKELPQFVPDDQKPAKR